MQSVGRWMGVILVGGGLLLGVTASASAQFSDVPVDGYRRPDGTYVAPHHRTPPNDRLWDNYSSQSQINPYTGVPGTKPNEFSTPPAYQQGGRKTWR